LCRTRGMKKEKQQREGMCPHCRRSTLHVLEWQYRRWDKLSGDTERSHTACVEAYFIKRSKPCDRSRPEAGATHPAFFCHFGRTGLVAIRKCLIVAEPCAVAV
jgi:hypothetical protein